jgi:glycerol kinase
MSESNILAIDQGTSGTKSIVFNLKGEILARGSEPLKSYYPTTGHVEQNPEDIYVNVLNSTRLCLQEFERSGYSIGSIRACGISNQRETLVLWDKNGTPLHNAVVWQCKRSVDICNRLLEEDMEREINERTGLIIDPYFSGTKVMWLNEHHEQIREAITGGNAFFGNIDTWLLYKLTNGKSYLTDFTNASRTLFFNLKKLKWDSDLVEVYGLQNLNLPDAVASSHPFGESDFEGIFKKPIPITGMIGDSHAASFGEGCFYPGTAKATLGTGSSILLNTGVDPVFSKGGMVTTVCWSAAGRVDYALEGVIVTCGASIEWLKNQIGLFSDSRLTEAMATSVPDNNGVYLIPAFSGLGAPHWNMDARAIIAGLTFDSNKNHIVRAALESIPYQIKDVIAEMEKESGVNLKELKVDGGISANNFVVQFLSDLLDTPVSNIGIADVSALGAALIAGVGAGMYENINELSEIEYQLSSKHPGIDREKVMHGYKGWNSYISKFFKN